MAELISKAKLSTRDGKYSGRFLEEEAGNEVNWKDRSCFRSKDGEQMRDFRTTSNPRTFVDLSRETAGIEKGETPGTIGRIRWWVFKCGKLVGKLRSIFFLEGETLRVRLVYRDHSKDAITVDGSILPWNKNFIPVSRDLWDRCLFRL